MAQLRVDFLDVGPTKYGDCVLVRGDGKSILIDGAHPGDMKDKDGFTSIPGQLDALLGGSRPHAIDLLVVTHAHNDHIGCLPGLIDENVIRCAMAYVADPALGWSTATDSLPDPRAAAALAVLREEGSATLSDAALAQAVADAVPLRQRYADMLTALDSQGSLIRCTGSENRGSIEARFSGLGLRILGPSRSHLRKCHDQIENVGRDLLNVLKGTALRDAADGADAVRMLALADEGALLDQFGAGSALNDQSIVLAFEFGGRKVLLPGDMQFAEHEVTGLDREMEGLRRRVASHGPYDIIKTSHHTSYNGWSEEIGDEQAVSMRSLFLVHTGGRNDPRHPEDGALSAIRKLKRQRSRPLSFFRTDRNGLISFTISASGRIEVTKDKGRVNDFRPNADVAFEAMPVASTSLERRTSAFAAPSEAAEATGVPRDAVEVSVRVPHTSTRVTLTIDVAPGAARPTVEASAAGPAPPSVVPPPTREADHVQFTLPTDRQLPPLLFLTEGSALAAKIGANNVDALVKTLVDSGQTVLNVQAAGATPRQIADAVRGEMPGKMGVVLLGDVDVLPSERLDVLPPDVRAAHHDPEGDPDHYIVWSDEVYGCLDGDDVPELPVSRIPDGGSAATLARALRASGASGPQRFGIRNVARPFADSIFKKVANGATLKVSHPTRHTDLKAGEVNGDVVYIMLHGSDHDTRRFWGETKNSGPLEAISVAQVPASFSGVVLAGCCWGALTASHKALDAKLDTPIVGRSPANSLAVAFVNSGARAFVGCTGVHYSPPGTSTKTAGAPMHRAFLDGLARGEAPALALFNAKRTCLGALKAVGSVEELAIGLKIIRQFTCLGLGW